MWTDGYISDTNIVMLATLHMDWMATSVTLMLATLHMDWMVTSVTLMLATLHTDWMTDCLLSKPT